MICRTLSLNITFLLLLSINLFAAEDVNNNDPPNIIIILADDMGYSDLGCTGSEIETPNLDSMAKEGILFTHCYNTSRCCPTRAALLTGQYQWDTGLGHMTYTNSPLPQYQKELNTNCATIAELLRDAGYQTFMSGKWHVGDKRENWPDRRGFDQFYGTPTGGGIYFYPSKHYKRPVFHNGKQIEPRDWYSTDGFTDATVDYLKNRRDKNRPFFMYLAYIAPHFPLQAKEEDIAKYKGKYDKGYNATRKARYAKQQELGIVSEKHQLTPSEHPKWKKLKRQDEKNEMMTVYAAMVDCLDQNIGRVLTCLEEEGLDENTLVVFLSDNGGCRASFNKTPKAKIGTADSNAAYGAWYNVSNTPYRKAKSQVHEGGIITPMIARWPKGIGNPNRYSTEVVHVMDLMPTCLKLAGAKYPNSYNGNELDPIDGINVDSLFTSDESKLDDRTLFWEHEGNRAVRRGDWKLVSLHKGDWELYNLQSDPCELNDLSKDNPQLAEELHRLYENWAEEHGVKPWPLSK